MVEAFYSGGDAFLELPGGVWQPVEYDPRTQQDRAPWVTPIGERFQFNHVTVWLDT